MTAPVNLDDALRDGTVGADPGSFRDRDSRVVISGDDVLRVLSAQGLEEFEALRGSALFRQAVSDGRLVGTELADVEGPSEVLPEGCAAVLRHERVPFVSYPYEWTFGMLRDAALLQLDLLDGALAESLTLKDATPYNVQWRGTVPTFVDVGSFERLRESEPWIGYRQFCSLFLFPLMLQAYRDVPFQPWLRGSLEGISPEEAARTLSLRDRLRRGVLIHVALHARLQQRHSADSGREAKRDLKAAGFKPEIVRANVRKMRRLVERLRWTPPQTAWTGYGEDPGYAEADRRAKEEFVASSCERIAPALVWDLGTNDGTYARIASRSADHVVAMDADHATVEQLYRALRDEGARTILPLVIDLCDPSPDRGWRHAERPRLERRGRPGLILSLALVHHVSITRNVPLAEVVEWLAGLGDALVVEFPTREDPMVERLLAAKRDDAHADYALEHFDRLMEQRFTVHSRVTLPSNTRVLYEATPRGA
jgi:hypothetical protein